MCKPALQLKKYVPILHGLALGFFAMLIISLLIGFMTARGSDSPKIMFMTTSLITGVLFFLMTFLGTILSLSFLRRGKKTQAYLAEVGTEITATVTHSKMLLPSPYNFPLPHIFEIKAATASSEQLHFVDYVWKPADLSHRYIPKVGEQCIVLFSSDHPELAVMKRPLHAFPL